MNSRRSSSVPQEGVVVPRLLYCDSRCSQAYCQRSQVCPRLCQLLTGFSSALPVTMKAGRNALLGSDTLLKLTHPSLHSTSSPTLLEASSDQNTFRWCTNSEMLWSWLVWLQSFMPGQLLSGIVNPQNHLRHLVSLSIFSSSCGQWLTNNLSISWKYQELHDWFALEIQFSVVWQVTCAHLRHLVALMGSLDVSLTLSVSCNHFSRLLESCRIPLSSRKSSIRTCNLLFPGAFHCLAPRLYLIFFITLPQA